MQPLNIAILVLTAGCAVIPFRRRAGFFLILASLVLFVLGGVLPLGSNGLVWLESRIEAPEEMPERVDGIIILGGVFLTNISRERNTLEISNAVERLTGALALLQEYEDAILIFTGGDGHLLGKTSEAVLVREFLQRLHLEPAKMIYEFQSRNTYENAVFTKQIVAPEPDQRWILMTSAYHMPRSLMTFRSQGWQNITPYPVDYRTDGQMKWYPLSKSIIDSFYDTHLLIHELVGIAVYRFTGKINAE